jgi:alpha-amylase
LNRYSNAPGIKAWFTSNHDENSWNGTEYEKYGDATKVLDVHTCTWPGIPLVYSGQELPNHKRLKFFDKDVIEWRKNCELHEFYQTLLNLHHNNQALHTNAEVFRLYTSDDAHVFAYLRKKGEHEVVVLLNFSNRNSRFDIRDRWVEGNFKEVFTHGSNDFSQNRSFEIEAWGWLVYVKSV